MSQIAQETLEITTTGGAGAATGSAQTIPINGFLLDLFVAYNSMPATTDLTVSEGTFGNILVLTNNNTDGWHAPRKAISDGVGAAQALYDLIPINGPLTVSLAQADADGPAATVTIRWLIP